MVANTLAKSTPPKTPCSARKPTSSAMFCAWPQSADARTKPIMPASTKDLRPKRSQSFPASDALLHVLAVPVELPPSFGSELDEHDATVVRVLEALGKPLSSQRIHELGKRRRGHRAALGELTAAHRSLAQLPHHAGAIRGDRILLAGVHRHLAKAREGGEQKPRQLEL